MTKRLAVLADIHGNLLALEAVLEDLEKHPVDGIIAAGDHIGFPHTNQVVEKLRQLDGWYIQGNVEVHRLLFDSGQAPDFWYTSLIMAFLRWSFQGMDPENLDFIRELPEQRVVSLPGTDPIRVVHGSPRDPSEYLYLDEDPAGLDEVLALVEEPVLVCAHSHRPWQVERHGKLILNPGAVCRPRNGFVGAQYALLTWEGDHWQAEHFAVEYDIQQLIKDTQASGYLEEGGPFATAFLKDIETGREVHEEFREFTLQIAAEAGYRSFETVPDEIWEQAFEEFDWSAT